MSNDQQLAILTGGNMPAFARTNAGAELNKEAVQGTGGESINRISLKQSRFRLIVGGEQVSVIDEPYMDVVVVRTNPNVSKAYYSSKYDPNKEDQSPDCYSSNGVVPDADVQNKQCDSCANCPMNQWGSKISEVSGAKVKACSDVKRIGIVPASNVEAPMFQIAVPAASMKVWGNYVRMLNQATPAIPYNGVVTRISFDPDSDFPKLKFEPKSWVTDEQYQTIQRRYDSEEAKSVTTTVDTPVQQTPDPQADVKADAFAQAEAAQQEQAAKQQAELQAKAEAEAKAKADAQRAAQKAAQEKAKADEQAAQQQQQQQQTKADPWATATTAAEAQSAPDPQADAKPDAFAQAGWGNAAPEQSKEPPAQEHAETQATVVDSGSDIDAIFGAGFDD